jgi:hypothetical protein
MGVRSRWFNWVAAVALATCLVTAFLAVGNYAAWVEGYVPSENSPVIHDASNLMASWIWAVVTIPVAVVPLIWLLIWLNRYVKQSVRQAIEQNRLSRGRCPVCGYDLRASKDCCSECGTPIPIEQQSIPSSN